MAHIKDEENTRGKSTRLFVIYAPQQDKPTVRVVTSSGKYMQWAGRGARPSQDVKPTLDSNKPEKEV